MKTLVRSLAKWMDNCTACSEMKKILPLFILLAICNYISAQSLKDSLFGGKLKRDTVSGTVAHAKPVVTPVTDTMYVTVDTSLAAKQEAIKRWEHFLKFWMPVDHEMDTKVRKGVYKLMAYYIVQPDGELQLLDKIDCDSAIEYLKPVVKQAFTHAPLLIPSHNNGIYIAKIRRYGVLYTIEKKETTIEVFEEERFGRFTMPQGW